MGLFDTVECDYLLPDPRHQHLQFQTKDLACFMERYTITRDGRLLKHPWGDFLEGQRPVVERDVELPIHGDIRIYDLDPDGGNELVEYVVRFTHGRVERVRRERKGETSSEAQPPEPPAPAEEPGPPVPGVMGRSLTASEFSAHAPEKLELVGGRIPGGKDLLLLLLTSLGLRRAAALVGYDLWKEALPEAEPHRGLRPRP